VSNNPRGAHQAANEYADKALGGDKKKRIQIGLLGRIKQKNSLKLSSK